MIVQVVKKVIINWKENAILRNKITHIAYHRKLNISVPNYLRIITRGNVYYWICERCHLSCASCSNSTSCDTCIENHQKQRTDGYCISECGPRTFYNTNTNIPICENCDSDSCTDCIIAKNKCSGCSHFDPPKFLKNSDNSCVNKCDDGYFGDLQTKLCTPCDQKCQTCSGPSSTDCESCKQSGDKFFYKNECYSVCPQNTILNKTDSTCSDCPSICTACGIDGCTSCLGNHPPENGICKFQCGEREVWMPPNNCEICDDKCDKCSEENKVCTVNLNYQLKIAEMPVGDFEKTSTVLLEMNVFRKNGKPLIYENVIS
jgi:hypothetical protein